MNVELSAPVSPVFEYAHSNVARSDAYDEIAAHGEAESSGSRHSVDGGDEWFRCATDLGDGAMQVFEDLLEALAGPFGRRPRLRRQIAEIFGRASGADVFEIGAAAEDAADAP